MATYFKIYKNFVCLFLAMNVVFQAIYVVEATGFLGLATEKKLKESAVKLEQCEQKYGNSLYEISDLKYKNKLCSDEIVELKMENAKLSKKVEESKLKISDPKMNVKSGLEMGKN